MEEDAGKSVHDRFPGATAIDLNRAGVPLVEIVSEPDMRSAADAGAYLRVLKQVLEYTDISDVSMEEGSLRVDANISVRPYGTTALGTKTEVKNMNTFSGVERALEAEFVRQCALVEAGGTVEQQTMLWDGAAGEVRPSRSKEGSHDYRYFPEPDLPPLVLSPGYADRIRGELPEMPEAKRNRYAREFGLAEYDVEVLTANPRVAAYYEAVARAHGDAKAAANWVMGEVLASLKASGQDIAAFRVAPATLASLLDLVRNGTVSHTAGKQVLGVLVAEGGDPGEVARRLGLVQVSDDGALGTWIDEVMAAMPAEVDRFRKGEKKLQGVLIGAVMKRSRGSADPRRVAQLLVERLGS
jgi:aspartyl-tRNA(Asn)/glutamyl-tRNA(Gln) amidotransferase subunit B